MNFMFLKIVLRISFAENNLKLEIYFRKLKTNSNNFL